jgi:hypothetical protein
MGRLRAYAIDTGKDSDYRKQHTHSSKVFGAFGVPVMRREGEGECKKANSVSVGRVVARRGTFPNSLPIGRKTAPSPLTTY